MQALLIEANSAPRSRPHLHPPSALPPAELQLDHNTADEPAAALSLRPHPHPDSSARPQSTVGAPPSRCPRPLAAPPMPLIQLALTLTPTLILPPTCGLHRLRDGCPSRQSRCQPRPPRCRFRHAPSVGWAAWRLAPRVMHALRPQSKRADTSSHGLPAPEPRRAAEAWSAAQRFGWAGAPRRASPSPSVNTPARGAAGPQARRPPRTLRRASAHTAAVRCHPALHCWHSWRRAGAHMAWQHQLRLVSALAQLISATGVWRASTAVSLRLASLVSERAISGLRPSP